METSTIVRKRDKRDRDRTKLYGSCPDIPANGARSLVLPVKTSILAGGGGPGGRWAPNRVPQTSAPCPRSEQTPSQVARSQVQSVSYSVMGPGSAIHADAMTPTAFAQSGGSAVVLRAGSSVDGRWLCKAHQPAISYTGTTANGASRRGFLAP